MAAFHGKSGTVSFGCTAFSNIKSWTLDLSAETSDASIMGSSYKGITVGQFDWSATVECYADSTGLDIGINSPGSTNNLGGSAALILDTVSGTQFQTGSTSATAASAFCSGVSVNSDVGETVSVTYNFVCNGQIAEVA